MGEVKAGSRPPWVGLAAAVWVQLAAGSSYTFPLYSPSLKSVLGYTQQQLTMLGVANDAGENFGLIPGVLCNRFPPWLVLSIGASMCFLGFGVVWLAVSQTIVGLPYWLLWVALAIGTNSSAWLLTAVLVTNMRNFPLSRGIVSGILKGYIALSASVFTEIYTGVLHDSSTKLLFFLAIGVPVICLVTMYFVRPCIPASEESFEQGHFVFMQVSSLLLALYLVTTTILDDVLSLSGVVTYTLFGTTIFLLLAPLAIPIKMTLYPSNRKTEPLLVGPPSTDGDMVAEDSPEDVDMLLAEGEGAVKRKRRPRRGEDFKLHEALIKADFWLLFLVNFIVVGSGVTVLNNLAQIGIAAGVDDRTVLLCFFSFGNFAGRLGGGVVSEHFVKSRMLPRTVWMACIQILMAIAYLLLATFFNVALYISTALLGLCYGVQISVTVPTTSELFGLKNFGLLYNFMSLGNPLGAFLFSALLAGHLYDEEAAKQHPGLPDSSSLSCFGPDCFGLTFQVLAALCVVGILLSIILTVRIRPVYQMLYSSGSFQLPRSSLH